APLVFDLAHCHLLAPLRLNQLSPQRVRRIPRATILRIETIVHEYLARRHIGQRLTRDDDKDTLGRRRRIEDEPTQALIRLHVRRHFVRYMRADEIVAATQARVWKDHLRLAVVLRVEDVEEAVSVGFERKAYGVAAMKDARRVNADGVAVGVL